MKVKELIKFLNKYNQEADIFIINSYDEEEIINKVESCCKNIVVISTTKDTYDVFGDAVDNDLKEKEIFNVAEN